jgi:hypothetical protein
MSATKDHTGITSANKSRIKAREAARTARLVERTKGLIGQRVRVRTKDGPELGTVEGILPRPEGARRRGQYLHVVTPTGQFDRARSRTKIIRKPA